MTNYDTIAYVQTLISDVLNHMGVEARVGYEQSINRGLVFTIQSQDSRLLIGVRGTALYSLEHLVHALVSRHFTGQAELPYFSLDIDGYKRKRENVLKELIKNSTQAIRSGSKEVILPAMNKYERRFVHSYIQEQFPHLTTESFGEDPYRKIKIIPAI